MGIKNIVIISLASAVLTAGSISLSYAQPPIPTGQEPGAQAERFRAATERERARVEKKAPAPEIEVKKKEEAPAVEEGPAFKLKSLVVEGATVFTQKELYPAWKDYLDKHIHLKDLNTIAKNIEGMYVKKGYLAVNAYVPKQTIDERGVAKVSVAESKMGDLKIEGNKWFNISFIERYFHIKKNDLLNFNILQKDILRLNQFGDLKVKTLVSPGTAPQTADITLTCEDKFPWHIGGSADDQGTRLTGLYRGGVYARSTNVSGYGDSMFVNTILSKATVGESFSYAVPVDTYGTKIGFDYTFFKMHLLKEFEPFNINGYTNIYTPHIAWEMALTENFTANIVAGIYIKSIKKYMEGQKSSDDQLRLPYVGYDITEFDSIFGGGSTSFSPQLIFGTAYFLGSYPRNQPTASRPGTGGCFTKYYQALNRVQRMPAESYIQMRSQFQWASRDLPSSEQFQLGGAYTVRGYPEGDYLADSGAVLSLDWIFPMYLIPKEYKVYHGTTPLRNWIEPCVFMDVGGGHLMRTFPGERQDKFLMGLGGGVRVHIYDKTFLKFEWAVPTGDRPVSGAGPSTFYLTVQSET